MSKFTHLSALEKGTPYVVHGLRVDKVIATRIWQVARIVNAIFIRKSKKVISCFQIEVFLLVIFLCVSSVFPSFMALFTIIRTKMRLRVHINKVSNINKIITIISWRTQGMTPY